LRRLESSGECLPEQEHQALDEVSKIVVPRDLGVGRECNVAEHLMMSMRHRLMRHVKWCCFGRELMTDCDWFMMAGL
jgi:hypothetical protein